MSPSPSVTSRTCVRWSLIAATRSSCGTQNWARAGGTSRAPCTQAAERRSMMSARGTRRATTAARNDGRSGSSTGAHPSSIATSSPSMRAAQSSASGRSSVPSTVGSRAMSSCCGIWRRHGALSSRMWRSCHRARDRGGVAPAGPATGPSRQLATVSAADGLQPGATRLERLTSGCRSLRIARCLGSGELGLELVDRGLELPEHALGTRLLLGVLTLPALLFEGLHVVLHLAQPVFDHAHLIAGDLADVIPLALDAVQRGARLFGIGRSEQLLGLGEEHELLVEVGAVRLVFLCVDLGLGVEQHVAGGLELRPERVIELLAGATGQLPLVEQVAVVADSVGASGCEGLGALDERLLASAYVTVCGVELGEERLAVLFDGRAGRAEALPELVRLVLRQAGPVLLVTLPCCEQLVELSGRLLPLRLRRVLRRESLGLLDDLRTLGDRLGDRGLRLGLLLLGQLLRGARKRLESACKGFEVPDRVGRRDRLAQRGDRLGHVGGGSAAANPLLEEADLACEIGVLPLEVGECLLSRAVGELPDGALAIARPHEDGARLVDAAPRLLL